MMRSQPVATTAALLVLAASTALRADDFELTALQDTWIASDTELIASGKLQKLAGSTTAGDVHHAEAEQTSGKQSSGKLNLLNHLQPASPKHRVPPQFRPINGDGGYTAQFGEETWVKVGAGLRTSYNAVEDASPGGGSWSNDFKLDNMRLYFSGQGNEYIGFEFNTEINNAQFPEVRETPFEDGGNIRVLDAIAKFKLHKYLNLWFGRFLPPSDRSNLDGPYYLNTWLFPFVQFGYPNILQGRDDGAAIWGDFQDLPIGQIKYQVGVFQGTGTGNNIFFEPPGGTPVDPPNQDDNPEFTARLVWNLLEPEPGYYNQSTYYGDKDVLALGVAVFNQDDAVGTSASPRSFTGWSLDALFETQLASGGVVTLEGAFYQFDDNDAGGIAGPNPFTPIARQGRSGFVVASYLFPQILPIGNLAGRFQTLYRYQRYDRDFATTGSLSEGHDVQLNYIMDGHDARLSAVYARRNPEGGENFDRFIFGAQLQY